MNSTKRWIILTTIGIILAVICICVPIKVVRLVTFILLVIIVIIIEIMWNAHL